MSFTEPSNQVRRSSRGFISGSNDYEFDLENQKRSRSPSLEYMSQSPGNTSRGSSLSLNLRFPIPDIQVDTPNDYDDGWDSRRSSTRSEDVNYGSHSYSKENDGYSADTYTSMTAGTSSNDKSTSNGLHRKGSSSASIMSLPDLNNFIVKSPNNSTPNSPVNPYPSESRRRSSLYKEPSRNSGEFSHEFDHNNEKPTALERKSSLLTSEIPSDKQRRRSLVELAPFMLPRKSVTELTPAMKARISVFESVQDSEHNQQDEDALTVDKTNLERRRSIMDDIPNFDRRRSIRAEVLELERRYLSKSEEADLDYNPEVRDEIQSLQRRKSIRTEILNFERSPSLRSDDDEQELVMRAEVSSPGGHTLKRKIMDMERSKSMQENKSMSRSGSEENIDRGSTPKSSRRMSSLSQEESERKLSLESALYTHMTNILHPDEDNSNTESEEYRNKATLPEIQVQSFSESEGENPGTEDSYLKSLAPYLKYRKSISDLEPYFQRQNEASVLSSSTQERIARNEVVSNNFDSDEKEDDTGRSGSETESDLDKEWIVNEISPNLGYRNSINDIVPVISIESSKHEAEPQLINFKPAADEGGPHRSGSEKSLNTTSGRRNSGLSDSSRKSSRGSKLEGEVDPEQDLINKSLSQHRKSITMDVLDFLSRRLSSSPQTDDEKNMSAITTHNDELGENTGTSKPPSNRNSLSLENYQRSPRNSFSAEDSRRSSKSSLNPQDGRKSQRNSMDMENAQELLSPDISSGAGQRRKSIGLEVLNFISRRLSSASEPLDEDLLDTSLRVNGSDDQESYDNSHKSPRSSIYSQVDQKSSRKSSYTNDDRRPSAGSISSKDWSYQRRSLSNEEYHDSPRGSVSVPAENIPQIRYPSSDEEEKKLPATPTGKGKNTDEVDVRRKSIAAEMLEFVTRRLSTDQSQYGEEVKSQRHSLSDKEDSESPNGPMSVEDIRSSPRGSISVEEDYRSPRGSISIEEGRRSPRRSITVEEAQRSPRGSISAVESDKSPRASISVETNRSRSGSILLEEPRRSPRGSTYEEEPQRSPKVSISIEAARKSPRGSISVEEARRSPRGSISVEEARRSPRGSIPAEEPRRSPRGSISVEEARRSPRGSISVEDFQRSPRGSISVEEARRSPRGSISVEEARRSSRGSISVEDGRRSRSGSISVEEARRSPRGSISVEEARRSPRGSISVEEARRSPRGSTTVEEARRSPRESISVEDAHRSPRGSISVEEAHRSPRSSVSVGEYSEYIHKSPRVSRGSLYDNEFEGSSQNGVSQKIIPQITYQSAEDEDKDNEDPQVMDSKDTRRPSVGATLVDFITRRISGTETSEVENNTEGDYESYHSPKVSPKGPSPEVQISYVDPVSAGDLETPSYETQHDMLDTEEIIQYDQRRKSISMEAIDFMVRKFSSEPIPDHQTMKLGDAYDGVSNHEETHIDETGSSNSGLDVTGREDTRRKSLVMETLEFLSRRLSNNPESENDPTVPTITVEEHQGSNRGSPASHGSRRSSKSSIHSERRLSRVSTASDENRSYAESTSVHNDHGSRRGSASFEDDRRSRSGSVSANDGHKSHRESFSADERRRSSRGSISVGRRGSRRESRSGEDGRRSPRESFETEDDRRSHRGSVSAEEDGRRSSRGSLPTEDGRRSRRGSVVGEDGRLSPRKSLEIKESLPVIGQEETRRKSIVMEAFDFLSRRLSDNPESENYPTVPTITVEEHQGSKIRSPDSRGSRRSSKSSVHSDRRLSRGSAAADYYQTSQGGSLSDSDDHGLQRGSVTDEDLIRSPRRSIAVEDGRMSPRKPLEIEDGLENTGQDEIRRKSLVMETLEFLSRRLSNNPELENDPTVPTITVEEHQGSIVGSPASPGSRRSSKSSVHSDRRSSRGSAAGDYYQTSQRGSLSTGDDHGLQRGSVTDEDVNRSPRGSVAIEDGQMSPRKSLVIEEGLHVTGQEETRRKSLVMEAFEFLSRRLSNNPESENDPIVPTITVEEHQGSNILSPAPHGSRRSSKSSVHSERRLSKGSTAGDENRSYAESTVYNGHGSRRGSASLEDDRRSRSGSVSVNDGHRSQRESFSADEYRRSSRGSISVEDDQKSIGKFGRSPTGSISAEYDHRLQEDSLLLDEDRSSHRGSLSVEGRRRSQTESVSDTGSQRSRRGSRVVEDGRTSPRESMELKNARRSPRGSVSVEEGRRSSRGSIVAEGGHRSHRGSLTLDDDHKALRESSPTVGGRRSRRGSTSIEESQRSRRGSANSEEMRRSSRNSVSSEEAIRSRAGSTSFEDSLTREDTYVLHPGSDTESDAAYTASYNNTEKLSSDVVLRHYVLDRSVSEETPEITDIGTDSDTGSELNFDWTLNEIESDSQSPATIIENQVDLYKVRPPQFEILVMNEQREEVKKQREETAKNPDLYEALYGHIITILTLPELGGDPHELCATFVPDVTLESSITDSEWNEISQKDKNITGFTLPAITPMPALSPLDTTGGWTTMDALQLNKKKKLVNNITTVTFCGCGFLGGYLVGAATYLQEHAPHLLKGRLAGSSVGSLIAACLVCDIPLEYVRKNLLATAEISQKYTLGACNPFFPIEEPLLKNLLRMIPEDGHIKASGRLFLSLTRATTLTNEIVSEYSSREELVRAILCCCFLPFISGFTVPSFQGRRYIDGGMSNNMPLKGPRTLTINAFSGEFDICPDDPEGNNLPLATSFNQSIKMTRSNLTKLIHALIPPKPEELDKHYYEGYNDAQKYFPPETGKMRNL